MLLILLKHSSSQTHACLNKQAHMPTYNTHTHTHTRINTHTHTCINAHTHTHQYTHTHHSGCCIFPRTTGKHINNHCYKWWAQEPKAEHPSVLHPFAPS